jgi:hypothetical protein
MLAIPDPLVATKKVLFAISEALYLSVKPSILVKENSKVPSGLYIRALLGYTILKEVSLGSKSVIGSGNCRKGEKVSPSIDFNT